MHNILEIRLTYDASTDNTLEEQTIYTCKQPVSLAIEQGMLRKGLIELGAIPVRSPSGLPVIFHPRVRLHPSAQYRACVEMSSPLRRSLTKLHGAISPTLRGRGMSRNETVPTKSPNVLVLCTSLGDKRPEKDSEFLAVRECLTACLDSARYAVYPLHLDDVAKTPWKDNCTLLVLPSARQSDALAPGDLSPLSVQGGHEGDGVLNELVTYVSSGGTLLSMHPVTNAALGFEIPECFQQASFVQITTSPSDAPINKTSNEWVVAWMCASNATVSGDFPPLPVIKTSKVLAKMRKMTVKEDNDAGTMETSDLGDCIQHFQFDESLGQVVLSHVDLLGSAGLHGPETDIPELITLKRDAGKVTNLLRMVLEEIGMECSKSESSNPTLSYLICSDQVHYSNTIQCEIHDITHNIKFLILPIGWLI